MCDKQSDFWGGLQHEETGNKEGLIKVAEKYLEHMEAFQSKTSEHYHEKFILYIGLASQLYTKSDNNEGLKKIADLYFNNGYLKLASEALCTNW